MFITVLVNEVSILILLLFYHTSYVCLYLLTPSGRARCNTRSIFYAEFNSFRFRVLLNLQVLIAVPRLKKADCHYYFIHRRRENCRVQTFPRGISTVKSKRTCPGFELGSPCHFPSKVTIYTTDTSRYASMYVWIRIWVYVCMYDGHTISFQTFFVWVFNIVVDSWKFSMLLLYILWDDWPNFMISASNEQLQQQLEYTPLKPDCHSWWI